MTIFGLGLDGLGLIGAMAVMNKKAGE